jgi:D-amino peptidase
VAWVRVLVSVDMEGIAGVTGAKDVEPGTPAYERLRRLMTEEANAVVAGAFDGGADSAVVNDAHDGMRNLLYEALDERAELISGVDKSLCMVEGVQDCDAALFVGYHAWAGTARAVLDHTISSALTRDWYLNGVRVGEAQINAALCGHFGVPVVMVAGDDKLAEQVRQTLPDARRVVVKHAIDQQTARSLPVGRVRAMLREAAADGVRRASRIPAVRLAGRATFKIAFTRTAYAEMACRFPSVRRVDDRTVSVTGRDVVEAWRMADGAVRLGGTAAR